MGKNLILERFQPGHPLYTEKVIINNNIKVGVIGSFQAIFGQYLDQDGNFLCYSMERKDTLIAEGVRKFKYYNSPANGTVVLLYEDAPGSNTYDRKFETHPANWAYQLKGCNAPGLSININVPEITNSRAAFDLIKKYTDGQTGAITIRKHVLVVMAKNSTDSKQKPPAA